MFSDKLSTWPTIMTSGHNEVNTFMHLKPSSFNTMFTYS